MFHYLNVVSQHSVVLQSAQSEHINFQNLFLQKSIPKSIDAGQICIQL